MGESKQVKVDNWGIFFLQRLQTFFNKTYFCDLTLQFEDNVQLKVHRLVMNACTEYFQVLEQSCEVINDCLIMPPDLQADVVVPIVNFMYTGILEYQMSIFDRLYSTARLMNMTVLTKLLDAQKVPISPITKPINRRASISPVTWNLQGKKITPRTMDPDLPEPLPGRKLPIWKRKSAPSMMSYRSGDSIPDPLSVKYFRSNLDDTPKPTRFEWPEDDDTSFDSNSFDEISYTSKPLLQPQREKSPKPSTSNFEELKRSSVSVKRPASPVYNDNKKVNIQDVKEYIKEQKLRSDYIDYDDSEAADNDLQTYENDNDSEDDVAKEGSDECPNKSILKNDSSTPHNKRVRFSLEGKENAKQKSETSTTIKTNADMSNHTKIITEVLKKYPHLVKKNKNIRLKILAKGANATGQKSVGAPIKVVKPASKVSYMVMKPEQGNGKTGNASSVNKNDGHWSCHRCSNPNPLQFETYYLYRKHLTEVHNEKTDSQMCNVCGHISRKQNMLMYHKFIKHNITPPPSYHFPKCNDCPYIALSPTLLTKHRINHIHQNLVCAECSTPFPTKMALISHIQLTGHSDKANCPTFDCGYCTKKFISDETLFQHIKNHHKEEARRDNILSQADDEEVEIKKENIITAEEIDALEEQEETLILPDPLPEKPKEKIRILSDVKVTKSIQGGRRLHPIKFETAPKEEPIQTDSQPLEPSSEAESLSNVASGIAASLGLVNTIVVLDDNQFILQSQETAQENIQTENTENFILSDNINMENLVSQHQVIRSDNNTIISEATLNKNNITSTDELVMVLTDHDYSDAANNAVITSENSNIVVLYSHPVQNQDEQFIPQPENLMLNSDMSLVEVSNEFAVDNTVSVDNKRCEESIELIQQEINNHLEEDSPVISQTEKIVEQIIDFEETKPKILSMPDLETGIAKNILVENNESDKMDVDETKQLNEEQNELPNDSLISTDSPKETITEEVASVVLPENMGDNHFEEPMEIEESIEMIQQEINKNSTELESIIEKPENIVETSAEDNLQDLVSVEENSLKEVTTISEETEVVKQSVEQQTIEKEKEEINEITQENIEETNEITQENIEETNEITQENEEEINENIQEDEQMEVDSTKHPENENSLSTETEQIEPTIVTESIPENTETENNISDDIVPDSEEEKSQNSDLQLQSLENEAIYESAKEMVSQNTELSQEMQKESTEETEKQNDSETEECQNVSEILEQETVESIQKETKEVEDTDETNKDSTVTLDNQEIERSPEILQDNEIQKETENEMKIIQQNDKEELMKNPKISNLLDDWDDGDTDSQQSDTPKLLVNDNKNSINTLINDWEDEEES